VASTRILVNHDRNRISAVVRRAGAVHLVQYERRMTRARRLILSLLLMAPTLIAGASDKALLIELDPRTRLFPSGVSATGAIVVGSLDGGGGFYWMPTTGVIFNGGNAAANVSRDGRTIVGTAADSRGIVQAAIWLRATEWKLLGSFGPSAAPCDMSLGSASATSSDGRVVVGRAANGCNLSHAFRWEESTGIVDLGSSVAGRASFARDVSGDGKVVVGWQERADGVRQGARWVDGRQELVPAPAGSVSGFVGDANAANSDGSIVVGRICRFGNPLDQSAWVWTPGEGTRCLPAPSLIPSPGPVIITDASGLSDDGRIVGGRQGVASSPDSNAVIWIDGTPSYLKDYLRANGVPDAFQGWINTGEITDVSPDGRILVGYGAPLGGFRGYIVILGEKP
jgi:probable HAF family extracellular repeat protein